MMHHWALTDLALLLNSRMKICKQKTALAAHKWSNRLPLPDMYFEKMKFVKESMRFKAVSSSQLNILWSKMAVHIRTYAAQGGRWGNNTRGPKKCLAWVRIPFRPSEQENVITIREFGCELVSHASLKNDGTGDGNFVDLINKRSYELFFAFVIFPVISKILSFTDGKLVYCFRGIQFFFFFKFNLKKVFEP